MSVFIRRCYGYPVAPSLAQGCDGGGVAVSLCGSATAMSAHSELRDGVGNKPVSACQTLDYAGAYPAGAYFSRCIPPPPD